MAQKKTSKRPSRAPDLTTLCDTLRRVADAVEHSAESATAAKIAATLAKLHESATAALDVLTPPSAPHKTAAVPAASPFAIDREANALLQTWGQAPLDEFLQQWSRIDSNMLQRTCAVVGLPATQRWTRPQKTELHRRASRFWRNTML